MIDLGEPAVSYRWNQLSLRNNQLKLKTAAELPNVLEESMDVNIPQFNQGKPEYVNM